MEPYEAVDKINYFFDKNGFDIKDKYFILKKMQEEAWEEIQGLDDDEEDEVDDIDSEFEIPDNEDIPEEYDINDVNMEAPEEEDDVPVISARSQRKPKKEVYQPPIEDQERINREIAEAEAELGNVEDIERKKAKIKASASFLKGNPVPRRGKSLKKKE